MLAFDVFLEMAYNRWYSRAQGFGQYLVKSTISFALIFNELEIGLTYSYDVQY